MSVLREREVEAEGAECRRRALEILVRKVPDDKQVGMPHVYWIGEC